MLALGVIATVGVFAAVIRYFQVREDVPPMQRHARALEALRDLSEHPRPSVDLAIQPEMPIDHVRILDDVPAGSRRVRKPSATRAATKNRRSTRGRAAAVAGRPTIQIRVSADRPRPLGASLPAPVPTSPTGPGPEPTVPESTIPKSARPEPTVSEHGLADVAFAERFGRRRAPVVPARAWAVVSAVGVVAVAVTLGIVLTSGGRNAASGAAPTTAPRRSSPSSLAPTTAPSRTSSTSVAVATPVVALTPNGATVTVHAPFRLTLTASALCWLQITDSTGTQLFSTTMQGGQSQDIPVTRAVTLQLGNAPAMRLAIDGVAITPTTLARVANIAFQTT
jgi:cytoskeletal protein RodZ